MQHEVYFKRHVQELFLKYNDRKLKRIELGVKLTALQKEHDKAHGEELKADAALKEFLEGQAKL